MENQGATFGAFLPLIILMVPIIFICRQLAKEKGKDTRKYTFLGCIPLVNYYILAYLIGAPDKAIEEKLDQVLALVDNR